MAYTVTPINGAAEFPANENEVYPLVEKIAMQEIRGVKSVSRIEDGFFFYDLTDANGVVLETALIDIAKKQTYEKDDCSKSPVDPSIVARYFNNWRERAPYQATVRRDDIRKIIANKGTGVEEVVEQIINSLTEGYGSDEFSEGRNLLLNTTVYDYTATLGGTPANLKGVIYAIRDMYDTLREDNTGYTIMNWKTHAPEEDIRIALSPKLLNLLDVGELANILNLSKVDLFGKLVIVPVSDLDRANWYKVIVYDRKAMMHARRLYYMDNEKCVRQGYWNYYLFVQDLWAYNPLFKAVSMNFASIAATELAKLITPTPTPTPEEEEEEEEAAKAAISTNKANNLSKGANNVATEQAKTGTNN